MQVDDTRTRVYIHDLDEELADLDSENETLIFLPDIEQRLSKLPRQLLQHHRADEPLENQELVLYSTPKSLTVDEGHDVVRKAIIEARQRAQEKALEEATRVRQEDMNRKMIMVGMWGGWRRSRMGIRRWGMRRTRRWIRMRWIWGEQRCERLSRLRACRWH